jgi:hypothetical protein
MATKKPPQKGAIPAPQNPPPTEDDIFDEIEEDLFLSPDGSMTTYHEGDEDDPNSERFGSPPKFKVGNTEFCVTDLPLNKDLDEQ